jgi:nickel-dependent lactate racemase
MTAVSLKYGRSAVRFDIEDTRFDTLTREADRRVLSDAEIGERLDRPIDSPRLEDLVEPGQTILIVVPDATRQVGSAQVVNLLVRRLIANGTAPHEIRIIFATGIHRKVTDEEKSAILTPFIYQRIKTLEHDPGNLAAIVNVGETSGGIPVEVDRALLDHDHVIIIGGVNFHYFAGFTGGRKLICPGLASTRTVSATHKLAFDCVAHGRRDGVDTGRLDGNPVHEAFVECARKVPPTFAITTIANEDGSITDLYCGNWITSHRAACDAYGEAHTIRVPERRDLVIVSCGGYPSDVNMIQAHKALDAASRACAVGGTIVFIAECSEGLGRPDFLDWFDAADSESLARQLCKKYQVNGQTAWNLLRIAEDFDVRVVTSLDETVTAKMRLQKVDTSEITKLVGTKSGRGYLMPQAAKFHIVL